MYAKFEDMKGKIFTNITVQKNGDSDHITFHTEDGRFVMYHDQDCCEHVEIHEIVGDINDLIGYPILECELVQNHNYNDDGYSDSQTWSFYKLGCINGFVTITWCGESNGYYSEECDFMFIPKGDDNRDQLCEN